MVVGEYTAVLIPRFAGRDKSIALIVVLAFAALQWRGIRWGSFTQNLTSLLKTLVFAAIAIAAFVIAGKPLMNFVHGDDVDVERAKVRKHRAQKFRFDFEMMVRLELGRTARRVGRMLTPRSRRPRVAVKEAMPG